MSLADRLTPDPDMCKTARIRDALTPEDRDTLDQAIQGGVPWKRLSVALRDEGHPISDCVLARHYRGECCCGGTP